MHINDLLDKYILARWAYAIGQPIMSDMEYNKIHDILKQELPNNEYVTRTWSEDPCPIELLVRTNNEHMYRNISIIYSSESMDSLRTEEAVKQAFGGLNEPTRLSYKVDGWNNQINYYNGKLISGNTRGRATTPKDSNVLLGVVPDTIPMHGVVKIIGEASIPNSKWEEFKKLYGGRDQRASMSSVIAKNLVEYVSYKAFNIVSPDNELPEDKYSLLKDWGFDTPRFIMVNNYQQFRSGIDMLSKMDANNDVLTDGIVVENKKSQIAVRIGKWQESYLSSYVTGYIENYTAYGISMTLKIRPILVNGKNISVIDVTNISEIIKNNLRIGYPVAFVIRSGANPALSSTDTEYLQELYEGMYEDYCKRIDEEQAAITN